MRIGRLRKRVTLEARSASQGTAGQPAGTWAPVATVWASIEPLSGREMLAAEAAQSEVSHRVTLRYRAAITAAMRVNYGGRYFNIRAVRNINERDDVLILDCTEGQDSGGIG